MCTVPPMETASFLNIISLWILSRAEKWNSLIPVSAAMRAILFSFTPHPASNVILPAACFCNSSKRGIPSSAVDCWPEVRIRLHPSLMICSNALCGLRHTSNARWKVTDSPWAASISFCITGKSTSPSAVRQPNTTPSAPNFLAISISFSIVRISISEYRKSPPRGRIITCSRVWVSTSLAMAISP